MPLKNPNKVHILEIFSMFFIVIFIVVFAVIFDDKKVPSRQLDHKSTQLVDIKCQINELKDLINQKSDDLKVIYINNRLLTPPMYKTSVRLSKIANYLYAIRSKSSSNVLLTDRYFLETLDYYVDKYAKQLKIPYCLIYAIMDIESDFNPFLVSTADCIGLMQVNYKVWKNYYKIPTKFYLCNIDKNLKIGCSILKQYYDKTNNIDEAIKLYFGKSPKNESYLKKIKSRFEFYTNLDGGD